MIRKRTVRIINENISHWRRGMRLAKKMKLALPAMEASDTVSRYCLVCSISVS